MKERRLFSILLLFMIPLSLCFAETSNLLLTGEMQDKTSLEITDTTSEGTAVLNLDAGTGGVHIKIATIIEKSNSAGGYTVHMSTENNYRLMRDTDDQENIILYDIMYNDDSTGLGSTGSYSATSSSGNLVYKITDSSLPTDSDGVSNDLKIKYSDPGWLPSGTYTDTMHFTIESK